MWLVRKNKKSGYDVLLQKRSDNKDSFPGCYDISSAGHLPAGADYRNRQSGELEEELGIAVSPEDLRFLGMHEGGCKRGILWKTLS